MPNFQALWILTTVEAPNSRTSSVSHDAEWQLQIVLNSQKTSLGKSSYCRRNGCILKLVFKHLFILQLFLITWSETAPQQLQIVLHIENDPAIPIENSIMPRIIMASVIIISELKRWCPSCKNAVKKTVSNNDHSTKYSWGDGKTHECTSLEGNHLSNIWGHSW